MAVDKTKHATTIIDAPDPLDENVTDKEDLEISEPRNRMAETMEYKSKCFINHSGTTTTTTGHLDVSTAFKTAVTSHQMESTRQLDSYCNMQKKIFMEHKVNKFYNLCKINTFLESSACFFIKVQLCFISEGTTLPLPPNTPSWLNYPTLTCHLSTTSTC